MEKAIQDVYKEAESRSGAPGKYVSLAHVFDRTTETIYTDWSHLGPRGNEIVAQAIAERLLPLLQRPVAKLPMGSHSPRTA